MPMEFHCFYYWIFFYRNIIFECKIRKNVKSEAISTHETLNVKPDGVCVLSIKSILKAFLYKLCKAFPKKAADFSLSFSIFIRLSIIQSKLKVCGIKNVCRSLTA